MEKLAKLGLGAGMLVGTMACSELDDPDETCFDVTPCEEKIQALGGSGGSDGGMDPPEPGPWDCMNRPPEPLPTPEMPPEGYAYILPVVDFANPPTPPAGLTIKVCQIGDFECDAPLPPTLVTEPDPTRPYVHQINLPRGFDGYLRLEADGYLTNEFYFLGPILGSRDGGPVIMGDPLGMPRIDTMDNFFEEFGNGAVRDPNLGIVALRIYDCKETTPRTRAAGVALELTQPNSTSLGFTIINGLPAASNPPQETDGRGVSGFGNLQIGNTTIVAKVGDDEYSRLTIRVRANQLTQADLRYNYTYGH